MLVPHDMNGQTVGVLGLGGSGIAAVAALQAAGAHVVAFDDGKYQQDLPAIQMTDWRDWPWQDMAAMVISPAFRIFIQSRILQQPMPTAFRLT